MGIKLRQKSFGNSSSQLRFCTGSELVYEQKGTRGSDPAKVTHAHKMRTIRTKVVFDALIVANIDGKRRKKTGCRVGMYRYRHPHLQHVL